jgi:O-antigen/teichoic acid export membrane protein
MMSRIIRFIGSPLHWLLDDVLRRLLKNAGALFSGNMAASLLSLASLALAARALGVEGFGILTIITTYVLIVDRLVNTQTWQAVIRYGADALEQNRENDFKSVIKFGFFLDGATALLGTVLAASAAWYLGQWRNWDQQLTVMAAAYSITILFHVQGAPMAVLRLFDRFDMVAWHNVIAAVIKLTGAAIAFLAGAGLWAFLLVWAVVDILGKSLLVFFSYRELASRGCHKFLHADIRNMSGRFAGIWGFVWTTNLNSSIRMASREADVMIIAAILGTGAVGLYKIAKQFSLVIQRTIDPLYQSIFPELARLFSRGEGEAFVRLVMRSSILAGLFAFCIWLGFFFFGEHIISLIAGAEYLSSKGVMLWYMLATVVAAASFPLQPAMLSMGLPQTTFWVHLGSTMVYFLALPILLGSTGLVGAGMAYLIYYVAWSLAMLGTEAMVLSKKLTYAGNSY